MRKIGPDIQKFATRFKIEKDIKFLTFNIGSFSLFHKDKKVFYSKQNEFTAEISSIETVVSINSLNLKAYFLAGLWFFSLALASSVMLSKKSQSWSQALPPRVNVLMTSANILLETFRNFYNNYNCFAFRSLKTSKMTKISL